MDHLKEQRIGKIKALVGSSGYKPMKAKEMAFFMGVSPSDTKEFFALLETMEKDGVIVITSKGKIMEPEALSCKAGYFNGTGKGFGFVILDGQEDVYIGSSDTAGAMHKDYVLCRIINPGGNGQKAEGVIVKVLRRGLSEIIGTFYAYKNGGYVTPDDKKISGDIYISRHDKNGAADGHKVAVKITKPPTGRYEAEGKVIDIIGHINEPGTALKAILRQHGISHRFPAAVAGQATAMPEEVLYEGDLLDRADYRDVITFTIDSEDTKDIDDAVSIEELEEGGFRLGVYIADVSHYVKEGSPLDKEALKRGTSLYFLDKVVPMLPYELSNGICSLNAETDRLALSCIMDINEQGHVINHDIKKTIINVKKKMSYEKVASVLTDEKSAYLAEYEEYMPKLRAMERLADILREKRISRGAIEFGFPEAKIIVDENGKPVDIKPRFRNVATGIIEEFMILCNETVAQTYFWLDVPFVYRCHEKPDPDNLERLAAFVSGLGYTLKAHGKSPHSIQSLLAKTEGSKEAALISRVVLRSFKQARYTANNLEHFGLASKCYCHFTSPIRRYPDLQIHRIISEHLDGKLTAARIAHYQNILHEVSAGCSGAERNAEGCERAIESIKKAEYMADKNGQQFGGIISGITTYGMYVELENTVSGLIPFSGMEDDYYVISPDKMSAVGERTRTSFRIGDKVSVTVEAVNIELVQVDFRLVQRED